MKIVVIGGTGLIGSRVVDALRGHGHEAVAAAPATGVDVLTGAGLADVLRGASVVVDVTNSPSFEEDAARTFFETSTRNVLGAEADAGVGHHVALSVVGTDRLQASGYFRAKAAQERLIGQGPIPWSIVHSTQFFEFVGSIADVSTEGSTVRLPRAFVQPIAADDVGALVGEVAVGPPVLGIVEIAGPERFGLDELVRRALRARHDPRTVVTDDDAPYFGVPVEERTLVPGDGARLAATRLEDWLERTPVAR
jgi:uncharacterized protein YbjT (DUF2867 family)